MNFYFSTDYTIEEITNEINKFIIDNCLIKNNKFKIEMDLTEIPEIKTKPKLRKVKLWED